jgi:hypothetical protein
MCSECISAVFRAHSVRGQMVAVPVRAAPAAAAITGIQLVSSVALELSELQVHPRPRRALANEG